MKGSAITGPVGKEAADLWPKIASHASSVLWVILKCIYLVHYNSNLISSPKNSIVFIIRDFFHNLKYSKWTTIQLRNLANENSQPRRNCTRSISCKWTPTNPSQRKIRKAMTVTISTLRSRLFNPSLRKTLSSLRPSQSR
jgi:hypothetical protein